LADEPRNPQQAVADAQKDSIRTHLEEGMRRIADDLERTYDPKSGFSNYPANRGRISVAEVLRRAGGIDKNTLKQSYHAETRAAVRAFVAQAQTRCCAHAKADATARQEERKQEEDSIERYAQLLYAAEYKRDEAIAMVQRLQGELAAKDRRIEELEQAVIKLQGLSGGNIIKLRGGDS
jgi:hypothetical protein